MTVSTPSFFFSILLFFSFSFFHSIKKIFVLSSSFQNLEKKTGKKEKEKIKKKKKRSSMSSNSSNNEGSGTCCDGDGGRAVRETGQPARKRGVCDPTASVLAALPQLRPKYSQIVRYIVNHGGDFWKETRCTSHGTLREDLHVVPPYPLGGVQERVPLIFNFYFFFQEQKQVPHSHINDVYMCCWNYTFIVAFFINY